MNRQRKSLLDRFFASRFWIALRNVFTAPMYRTPLHEQKPHFHMPSIEAPMPFPPGDRCTCVPHEFASRDPYCPKHGIYGGKS